MGGLGIFTEMRDFSMSPIVSRAGGQRDLAVRRRRVVGNATV